MIHFDAVTLFPEVFDAITRSGITRRAFENGVYGLVLWNPRDFSTNAYRQIDDRPYGGGPGMVMDCRKIDGKDEIGPEQCAWIARHRSESNPEY